MTIRAPSCAGSAVNTEIVAQIAAEERARCDARQLRGSDRTPCRRWSGRRGPDGFHDYHNRQWYAFTRRASGLDRRYGMERPRPSRRSAEGVDAMAGLPGKRRPLRDRVSPASSQRLLPLDARGAPCRSATPMASSCAGSERAPTPTEVKLAAGTQRDPRPRTQPSHQEHLRHHRRVDPPVGAA